MGAQVAAHLANAGLSVLLLELAADGSDKDALARKAVTRLPKLKPAPLSCPNAIEAIEARSYDTGMEALGSCDLVIEAVAERIDLKADLFARIAPHLGPDAVVATNTSGLSVGSLAATLPESIRPRFCGIHFFNPPRYMHLVELIPGPETDEDLLDTIETFLVTRLGKGVVRAKDVPNFVANRIGVFSMLTTFHHAARLGLEPDIVDALTGPLIGRPKSATWRTADIVGLDTLGHVVEASAAALTDDPWHRHYVMPRWVTGLVDSGALGQKSGAGVYKKTSDGIQVFDQSNNNYRASAPEVDPEVTALFADAPRGTLPIEALRDSEHPQAQLLWCIHRDVWHYAAVHLAAIAHTARDLDLAMRWGFGWARGPFEIWQSAGWGRVAAAISKDIAEGRALADRPLPPWVMEEDAAHVPQGSWDANRGTVVGRSRLPVYHRQRFPDRVLGETPSDFGDPLFETDAVRLWSIDDTAVLTTTTKLGTLGTSAIEGIVEAIDVAAERADALVLWRPDTPFCAGADIAELGSALDADDPDRIDRLVRLFQTMTSKLRYAPIPVVGAPNGLAIGGGCELLMYCDRRVAGLETYMGLVEIGVGLLPAGGGLVALARAAATTDDPLRTIASSFERVAKAAVSASAEDARRITYLDGGDVVVMHPHEVLHAALATARGLAESGYRAPLEAPVAVVGATGVANLKGMIANLHVGGWATDHDALCATKIAEVLCGGDLAAGTLVSEEWMLDRERTAFMELCATADTRARIAHMLKTGKPLRN